MWGDVSVQAGGSVTDALGGDDANIMAQTVQVVADSIGEAEGTGNGAVDIDALNTAARADGSVYLRGVDDLVVGTTGMVEVTRIALNNTTSTISDNPLIGVNDDRLRGIEAQL